MVDFNASLFNSNNLGGSMDFNDSILDMANFISKNYLFISLRGKNYLRDLR